MKNATNIKEKADEIIYDEVTEEEKSGSFLIKNLLSFFAGFAFSCFEKEVGFSPFSLAFISATPYSMCLGAFMGSSVGYLITYPLPLILRYTFAVTAMTVFRFLMMKARKKDEGSLLSGACAFFCLAVSGSVYLINTDFSVLAIIYLCAECVAASVCSYFFTVSFAAVKIGNIRSLCRKDSFCLGISSCLLMVCVSSITLEGISPGRIISCIVLMFISLYKGVTYSSVAGIVMGASLSLTPDGARLFPCFVIGSFFAGIFSYSGQIITAICFTFTYIFACLLTVGTEEMWVCFAEPCIAFACFVIIPRSKLGKLQDHITKHILPKDVYVSPEVKGKLRKAGESLYAVAETVINVSEKLDSIINPEVNRLFSSLQQKVCYGCEKKQNCWKKNFDTTASDILSVAGIEKRKSGKLNLAVNCRRYEEMCVAISSLYPSYAFSLISKNKTKEMRELLTDQFVSMGDYLCRLSDSESEGKKKDKAKSVCLKSALAEADIQPESVEVFPHRTDLYFMDIPLSSSIRKAKRIIEELTDNPFYDADIETTELFFRFTFKEKPLFRVARGSSQHSVKADKLCGDSYCFFLSDGIYPTAVISDGMGTGARAAMDSSVTVSVLRELASGGFSLPLAIKSANSALIMKSTDESTATVDAAQINCFTGEAFFYKAGAAVSFIRQGDEVTLIEKASLPLGILKDTGLSVTQKKLSKGDIVLLVSDGVTNGDCGWINDELLAWSTNNMNDLAGHIASLARLRNLRTAGDDITVLALKVENNK